MSSTNGKAEGIHVVGVEVSNLHRIRMAKVTLAPGGRVVKVSGANGSGKSSLLNAIKSALGGAGEVLPAAINDAAEDGKGHVRLQLTNGFTVERRFTESAPKGYLTITGPDGGKHGQAKLGEWLGSLNFDPLALFALPPARQREILLSAGSNPTLASQLDGTKTAYKALYDERTQWISQQRKARGVAKPEGERPEPVDTSAEMAKLRELQAEQRRQQDQHRALVDLQASVVRSEEHCEEAAEEVARLEEELAAAREALAREEKERDSLIAQQSKAEEAYHGQKSVDPDIEAVHERIAAADQVNASLEPWKAWERAQAELAEATAKVDEFTADMDRLKAHERKLIAEAGIPVPGLSFDPETGEPLLNERPLSVASGAERIRMAVAVAVAVNPQLRICLVDEANDLDLDALEELGRLAKEHDFMVWACRIGIEGPGEIEVQDGEALSVDAPEPAEVA